MDNEPDFPENVPGVDEAAAPAETEAEVTAEADTQAPVAEVHVKDDFDWSSFGGNDSAVSEPQREERRGGRTRGMGGSQPSLDMAEFFTEDGIGKILARGLDGFYKSCGADPMEKGELNQVAKVVAYYCQKRLPPDAKDYQPEILVLAAIGSTLLPRFTPVAEATGLRGFIQRSWVSFKAMFGKKEAVSNG